MSCPLAWILVSASFLGAAAEGGPRSQGAVSGELKKWHRVSITFEGPETSEIAEPNPFRDYRLEVTFARAERRVIVPGFYAADGNAAETGAAQGNRWRVHFVPDEVGEWTWKASFRTGRDIAISPDSAAGKPAAFDGAAGKFTVGPSDKTGRDFRAKGLLRYVGEHYPRFAETGEFFLKGGADSPENFMAYADFDGAALRRAGAARKGEAATAPSHRYEPHQGDWRPGDPSWRGGKGKGMIGALNYLAGKGMNSVYFLTMNVGGDGNDVWPWVSDNIRDRFDSSKLDQWEIVFSHMDRLGLQLHVVTQETENDQLLDGGALGLARKLYYRELVARFGHHLAVVWNLGEENTNTDQERKDFARYINQLDPYRHPVVVHTFPGKYEEVYSPLLKDPHFAGPSLQMGDMRQTHAETKKWVARSAAAGHKWIVSLDEVGPADVGVKPDADDPRHDAPRQQALWGNLMAGGAGAEWYFGYKFPHNDLNCEDFRSRDRMWDQTRYALDFFQQLPFARMRPADELVSGGNWCFALEGQVYAVYLPKGGAAELKIPAGSYTVQWFNPRAGGPLAEGAVRAVTGPGSVSLGLPPADTAEDWAVLVKKQ
ncbi:MAG: DUF5060 domain-containing protein [Pirellulales bacterium]